MSGFAVELRIDLSITVAESSCTGQSTPGKAVSFQNLEWDGFRGRADLY